MGRRQRAPAVGYLLRSQVFGRNAGAYLGTCNRPVFLLAAWDVEARLPCLAASPVLLGVRRALSTVAHLAPPPPPPPWEMAWQGPAPARWDAAAAAAAAGSHLQAEFDLGDSWASRPQ
jgi:hypothetical protein